MSSGRRAPGSRLRARALQLVNGGCGCQNIVVSYCGITTYDDYLGLRRDRAGGRGGRGKSVFADRLSCEGCAGCIGDRGHSYIADARVYINRAQESGVIV